MYKLLSKYFRILTGLMCLIALISMGYIVLPGIFTAKAQTAQNLIQNPSFENTGTKWLSPWFLIVRSGALATISQDTSASDGNYSAKIDVTQSAAKWLVQ